jgi:16S rRNA processing protein RimM
MKNELIETGIIVNTHGIHGEVKLLPWADSPEFLAGFDKLYIDGVPVRVLSAKVHKGNVIAALEGIDGIEAAAKLKNKVVEIKKDDAPLEEGRFFITDLIGLCAIDAESGEVLGTISDILTLPASNVYVIKGEREILIPAVPEFVVESNVKEGYVKFRLIEGL